MSGVKVITLSGFHSESTACTVVQKVPFQQPKLAYQEHVLNDL